MGGITWNEGSKGRGWYTEGERHNEKVRGGEEERGEGANMRRGWGANW